MDLNEHAEKVIAAMQPDQRAAVIYRRPGYTTAAEALVALRRQGAHGDLIAESLRSHPTDLTEQRALCLLAVLYGYGLVGERGCSRCAGRGRREANPPFAAEDPCRTCGGRGLAVQPVAPWEYVKQLCELTA